MKKTTILLVLVMLVTFVFIGCEDSEEAEYEKNKEVVEKALAQQEREQEREEENKREGKLDFANEHEFTIKNGYTYINGSLVNNSNKNIEYFKLTVEYKDESGKIIDTAYTNSGQTLRPGAEKRTEIMNEYIGTEHSYTLRIEEVRYSD